MAVAAPRLERYAVVALPVCTLGPAASADIIYTPVNQTLNEGQSWSASVNGNNLHVRVDGSSGTFYGYDFAFFAGYVTVENGDVAFSGLSTNVNANRFVGGQEIGVGANFNAYSYGVLVSAHSSSMFSTSSSYGAWAGVDVQGFVGFRVENGDDFNYGWLDITFTGSELIVGGYAYETDVNTAIIAGATEGSGPVVPGAPTAVGLVGLAAGAAGIRRQRSAESIALVRDFHTPASLRDAGVFSWRARSSRIRGLLALHVRLLQAWFGSHTVLGEVVPKPLSLPAFPDPQKSDRRQIHGSRLFAPRALRRRRCPAGFRDRWGRRRGHRLHRCRPDRRQ